MKSMPGEKCVCRDFLLKNNPHSGHIHHFAPKSDPPRAKKTDIQQTTEHPISHIYPGNRSCGYLPCTDGSRI